MIQKQHRSFYLTTILLTLSTLFTGCEKENMETLHQHDDSNHYKVMSLDELPKLKPVIENLRKANPSQILSRNGETLFGVAHVLTDKVTRITDSRG